MLITLKRHKAIVVAKVSVVGQILILTTLKKVIEFILGFRVVKC